MPSPASALSALLFILLPLVSLPTAGASTDNPVVAAREALRLKDAPRLAAAASAVNAAGHPLAQWVEYWELLNRLPQAQQAELDAFYARWSGSYVEDRLRNDWLLELGRRRDWARVTTEFPRFRMNDDREVTCYALLAQHAAGEDVRIAGRDAWFAQRDLDDGCNLLAGTLFEAGRLPADAVWRKAQLAVEFGRVRAVRAATALLGPAPDKAAAELLANPARYLARQRSVSDEAQLELLALMRLAASDPEQAASLLDAGWTRRLPRATAATAWAHVAKQSALKQLPQAADQARQAWKLWEAYKRRSAVPWGDDLLAWHVRAALRDSGGGTQRWALATRAIESMSPTQQQDATWVYWKARAAIGAAPSGDEGAAARAAAQSALQGIAGDFSFYGKLATEELGGRITLPPPPAPLSDAERAAARGVPGLARALQLIDLGLRSEGVREWNFTLRGLDERQLLAAAQWACEREVWDRCINTSERTRGEIDMAQRFPLPYRSMVMAKARDTGLDPALLYGLIRQESRFITDARSGVGASGLMQLMPATASWTARKVGLAWRREMITDPDINLLLGASYLKRLVDDFDGSLAMATAAYNAGPGRPRRWREGATVESAAWAESIPFNETRDYVKKVLSNSVYYAAMLGQAVPTLKSRLGPAVGPRSATAPAPDRELP